MYVQCSTRRGAGMHRGVVLGSLSIRMPIVNAIRDPSVSMTISNKHTLLKIDKKIFSRIASKGCYNDEKSLQCPDITQNPVLDFISGI